ncbi:hypothetical protein B484DRAFT_395520 [Ochromonadaceae sp. CCMP2298]|nr:hypothetical protein B484DRAFT_395520 [Ochromonadaceae sp. CCMP2298]
MDGWRPVDGSSPQGCVLGVPPRPSSAHRWGFIAANVLHRREVTVFEMFTQSFEDRGGALGSVDDIPGHGHFYGSLWKYLYDGLPPNTVRFGAQAEEIDDLAAPRVTLADGSTHWPFDFVVGADGGASVVRKYVTFENRQVAEIKATPEWFLPFVRKAFGAQNHLYWETYIRRGKVAAHPVWEFAPREARQGRVVLLGDALHMATPRTGAQGAQGAQGTQGAQGAQGLEAALEVYARQAVARSDDLHRRSRSHAGYFAPDPSTTISPAVFAFDQGTY